MDFDNNRNLADQKADEAAFVEAVEELRTVLILHSAAQRWVEHLSDHTPQEVAEDMDALVRAEPAAATAVMVFLYAERVEREEESK